MIYMNKTLHDWEGSIKISDILMPETTPDAIIYSDASGITGYGCMCTTVQQYGYSLWDCKTLSSAFRSKSTSSTHLEIHAVCSLYLVSQNRDLAFAYSVTLYLQFDL